MTIRCDGKTMAVMAVAFHFWRLAPNHVAPLQCAARGGKGQRCPLNGCSAQTLIRLIAFNVGNEDGAVLSEVRVDDDVPQTSLPHCRDRRDVGDFAQFLARGIQQPEITILF